MSAARRAAVALSMLVGCGVVEHQDLDYGFTVLRSADYFFVLGADPWASISPGSAATVQPVEPRSVLVWARSAADPAQPIDGDVEGRTADYLVLPPGDYCPPVRARSWPAGASLTVDDAAKPCELAEDVWVLVEASPCSLACEETQWTLSLVPSN